ncbi:MAG: ribosomal protein S18-alanine N-acetyltransferase [Burkholderiaceae bacterium]|jgi:ribosomal-protein-alanine N-acetyltransferase|nr:ribosomal protein S18-alanine N-acetyltransferase [Burkholderiaceae bacterium]
MLNGPFTGTDGKAAHSEADKARGGMNLFFRQMTISDAEEIYAIERTVFTFPWSRAGFVNAVDFGYNCWVLCEKESRKIAGYFVLMTATDEGHLLTIALRKDLHGRGYGRILLNRAVLTAREHGMVTLFLEVRPSNTQAYSLYVRNGFQQVGIRKEYYPADNQQREDAIVMRLRL